jgi:hypothetical protein
VALAAAGQGLDKPPLNDAAPECSSCGFMVGRWTPGHVRPHSLAMIQIADADDARAGDGRVR